MQFWLRDDLASRKIVLRRAVLFSIVTLFVLFVFQPFGTNNHVIDYKYLRLSGYGLVTFCALLLSGALEIGIARLKLNRQLRQVIIPCIYIFFVSLFNHSYFVVSILGSWHWVNQGLFVLYTLAIGLFPITFVYLADYHVRKTNLLPEVGEQEGTEHNGNTVDNLEVSPQLVTLTGENKGDKLQLSISQLLFIKSADNYCEIAIMHGGKVSHQLLRSSLSSLLNQLPDESQVHRCHRSYAVNLELVETSTGNAGDLKLMMKSFGITVPVSRTYVEPIKQALSLVPEAC